MFIDKTNVETKHKMGRLITRSCSDAKETVERLWPTGVEELSLGEIVSIGVKNLVQPEWIQFTIWQLDRPAWDIIVEAYNIDVTDFGVDESLAIVCSYYLVYC